MEMHLKVVLVIIVEGLECQVALNFMGNVES
jgi:hypothetical protein